MYIYDSISFKTSQSHNNAISAAKKGKRNVKPDIHRKGNEAATVKHDTSSNTENYVLYANGSDLCAQRFSLCPWPFIVQPKTDNSTWHEDAFLYNFTDSPLFQNTVLGTKEDRYILSC
jgi:hypothetical protein